MQKKIELVSVDGYSILSASARDARIITLTIITKQKPKASTWCQAEQNRSQSRQ
jgi:hypothetical protein